jgi:hypothetical protein
MTNHYSFLELNYENLVPKSRYLMPNLEIIRSRLFSFCSYYPNIIRYNNDNFFKIRNSYKTPIIKRKK